MAKTKKTAKKLKTKTLPKSKILSEKVIKSPANIILKNKSTKYIVLAVFLLLLGSLLYLSKGLFIAAIVNGKPVSRMALIKNLEKTGGKQALDSLVTQELIKQEARKENITVGDEDIQ